MGGDSVIERFFIRHQERLGRVLRGGVRWGSVVVFAVFLMVWVGSFWWRVGFTPNGFDHYDAGYGSFSIWTYPDGEDGEPYETSWVKVITPFARAEEQRSYRETRYHLLGFAYNEYPRMSNIWWLVVPGWFPTLAAAFVCWFAWRRTRRVLQGRAFPVEPSASVTVQ